MKAPKNFAVKKPMVRSPAPRKPAVEKGGSGFSVDQALQLAKSSVEVTKSYVEYKKEVEATTRTLADGQKAIILGEQELEKARMQHGEKMEELKNKREESIERHGEAMGKLAKDNRQIDMKESMQDRILAQLEAKEITAEEAALLLYGSQE